jgi:predicted aspartyl protease
MAEYLTSGVRALREGRLNEAVDAISRAVAADPARPHVWSELGWAHYRLNDFAEAATCFQRAGKPASFVAKLAAVGASPAYVVSGRSPTTVPFLRTDPLPVVRIEVSGRPVVALIDTGAAELILDPAVAAAAGVEEFGDQEGRFAAGLTGSYRHGRLRELTIGEAKLTNLPVQVMPTARFSRVTGGAYEIGAIVGTGLLAQFLPTLDYPARSLVLRPRGSAAADGLGVPFIMLEGHLTYAQGSLEGLDGLCFLVDSGLAGGAFTCPASTLRAAGIPVPGALGTAGIGGGDGAVKAAPFRINELGLGGLRARDLVGIFGPFPPGLGAEVDCAGIISHGFLRLFRWTLDFDRYSFRFEG